MKPTEIERNCNKPIKGLFFLMCDQILDLARVSRTFLVRLEPNSDSQPQTNARGYFWDLWDATFLLKKVS